MANDIALPVVAAMPSRRPTTIKNLIPSLPERGKIKIGVKGAMLTSKRGNVFQPPEKLDHFTVTTLQRGADNNFLRDEAFHAKFGERPTEIPIRLLYDDAELNFPTRYACFIGRTLWCSGDGESATRLSPTPESLAVKAAIDPHVVGCTCHRQEATYAGTDRCKMNGNLSALIEGMGGVGGVWRFRTTSYNSIVGIMSSMAFLRSVTGGVLANIPLTLRLQPKQATNPQNPTQTVTIYVVSLEFAGDIAELQDIGHRIALARATTHVSIAHIEDEARRLLALPAPANAPLPGDDVDDVVEEFYPEQAANPDAAPPRPRRGDFITEAEPKPAPEPEPVRAPEPAAATLKDVGDEICEQGNAAFKAWWNGLAAEQRTELGASANDPGPLCAGWRIRARAADERGGPAPEPEDEQTSRDKPAERPAEPETAQDPSRGVPSPEPSARSFTVERHADLAGVVDIDRLRDDIAALVGEAPSLNELDRLREDNRNNINLLSAESPPHAAFVLGAIEARAEEIGR